MAVTFEVYVGTQGRLVGVLFNNVRDISLFDLVENQKIIVEIVNRIVPTLRANSRGTGLGRGRTIKEKSERAKE
jgi:hypothetical protein